MKTTYQHPVISISIFSEEELLTDIISVSNGNGVSQTWDEFITPED